MRILFAGLMILGCSVWAYAQPGLDVPGGPGDKRSGPPPEPPVYHVDEKDYKAALKRVPDSKAKYDPWGIVREAPKSKK
jgi:hypothetical protein